ncbi:MULTISPECIES: BhlA/UviB family holin-like peptide [Bacillaceae]|uniref:Uncharacterized protein n=1 Tax=Evansella alkalicola TaxID=745819 RepID=A0ABS6JZT8_9BACI|nr:MULTISPECIES: BhlA/UviB family holin-like peptide [Bacillaceae]MBU9724115.1 hypothetical protein [Bacillus alkalicola]
MDKLIDYAIQTNSGLFAVLFIVLLSITIGFVRWVIKTNNEREKRYIGVIDKQAEGLKMIDHIHKDVKEMKEHLFRK